MYELAEREDDQDETDLSDQPIINNLPTNKEQNQNQSLDDKPQIQITSSCSSSSSNNNNHNNNNSHKANHTPSNSFQLRRMACFGSPKYDRQSALHILSADSRFPDIAPGQQLASGNHFLALIPESIMRSIAREEGGGGGTRRRKRNIQKGASIRGGGANAKNDDDNNASISTGINIVRKRRKRRRGRGTDGKHQKGEFIEGAVNVNPSGEEEEGSFFSHGIFKLIRSSSERRTRSGFDSNSKSNGPVRSSIVEEEKGLWRWVVNLWIDCIMQFLNGI